MRTFFACTLLFILSSTLIQQTYAAGTVDPYQICNDSPDNCKTPANDPGDNNKVKQWKCLPDDAGGTGISTNRCEPVADAAKNECKKVTESCEINGDIRQACCNTDTDKTTALVCNPTTKKCERDTQGGAACVPENKPCGSKAPAGQAADCCTITNAKKETLSCIGTDGKPASVAQGGTCKFYAAITTIKCHCSQSNQAGDGVNGFRCDGQGLNDDKKDYQIYCNHSSQACQEGNDKSLTLDETFVRVIGRNSDYDDHIKGKTALGITCEGPTEAKPPSPPCLQNAWVDGQCQSMVTAFGDLQTDPAAFTTRVFAILLSFSGGIALLLIIRAGYLMLTSQGKPEQVQAGRDQLIAAIVGLAFLIFSMVLLQVIGFDILHVPGFDTTSGAGGTCKTNADCSGGMSCNFNGTIGKCQ